MHDTKSNLMKLDKKNIKPTGLSCMMRPSASANSPRAYNHLPHKASVFTDRYHVSDPVFFSYSKLFFTQFCLESCHISAMATDEMWLDEVSDTSNDISKDMLKSTFGHLTCTICNEFMFCPFMNSCGHSFCYTCSNAWFQKSMTCPVCRANVREAPIINHALRDILSSLIESVPESGGAAKEKLLQLKAEKEEEYQRDVGKGKRLFGGVFQSNQYARIVIDHGVPRCSRCQWEAWGGRCLYCNARFLNPREDDSEDYESPSDNSDADSDRPQQPANTHSHLSPEESARALGAARLAYARNTSDFQRDANIIIARARGIAALAGEDVSDGAEDFDYNPSDSDDEIYINENAADHYMPRQGNFSNTSLSYVANDSEDEPTVPARPRHVSRVPSVHENSSDDSVLMSDDDVHSVPLRSQHWRIASSGSSDY